MELDALKLAALKLAALELDALEFDALEFDALELDASLALGREPRGQHDCEGGNPDGSELSGPRQRPKKQIGQEVWMSHRSPPLFMTHVCRRESVIASTGNALHASALQRLQR